jgi:hypothetical protein
VVCTRVAHRRPRPVIGGVCVAVRFGSSSLSVRILCAR